MNTTPPGSAGALRFSVLPAVYEPPPAVLEDTIASVLGQDCDDWEWVVVDDCSPTPGPRERLTRLAAEEPRVQLHFRTENGGISAASQDALAHARGEFIVL